MNEEMSFEELRAQSRGWLTRDWTPQRNLTTASQVEVAETHLVPKFELESQEDVQVSHESQSCEDSQPGPDTHDSPDAVLENTIAIDITREGKAGRPRKTKVREVKGETQTSMASS